ncbi:Npt1/Npt2 family nucleotide transporter [Paenibacillus silvisoli]|uniref:Npt1/Npt2 family nucleotide transporter n=1 Tax=Paenibacillus silvisoli TaxID=3110539 RepID=UPI002803CDF6|nr:Npt1/Npt2 family nucleotide transporter [Paenibacillus silvisoli]
MKWISGNALGNTFRKFGDDKEEYTKVLFLFIYLFAVASASTVGRTAADALFLSRFGASQLSFMYVPQSAALLLIGLMFQRFSPRFRMANLVKVLIPVIAALVLVSRLGVGMDLGWVYPVIYVGFDVFNFLMVVCFWQFASSILDQRKVKRTIGLVGSGGLVGGIVSGFGLKLIVPLVGTANLICFYAALQLIALAAVVKLLGLAGKGSDLFAVSNMQRKRTGSGGSGSGSGTKKKEGMFRNVPHLKYIAIMSATLVITLTLIDYQFKVILRGTLQDDALAGFMGSFYGFSGLLALFIQLFVAGKLLTRFGVMTAILVFPVALFAGSLGVLLMPVLAMVVIAKGSDKVLGDTINSSVNQLVMFPIPPEWRNQAKSFLDGVVRNGAKGIAAVSLIVLSQLMTTQQFSYVILALLCGCIVAAVKVKGAYLEALLSTLKTRGHDLREGQLDLMDPASLRVLTDALSHPEKVQVLYALKILQDIDGFDLLPHIDALLRHPSKDVCVEALRYVERTQPAGQEDRLLAIAGEGHSRVRAAALLALASYAKDEYLDAITARLDETDMDVKSGAIAGLIKYYGIEGMFRAVGTLKQLLESSREDERMSMAILFGRIGVREFYKPLIPLLNDTAPQVRKFAVQSAGALQVPELVPHIVPLLAHNETREATVETLAAYEEREILKLLGSYFDADAAVSLHLPKVYERIGSQQAFEQLFERYAAANFEMRDKLLEAMSRMRKGIQQVDAKGMEASILLELELYWRFTAYQGDLLAAEGYEDVAEAAEQARSAMIKRVFQLLGFIYEAKTIQAVYVNWTDGGARQQANAAEVIDQLVQGNLRLELAKLMSASRTVTASASRNEAALDLSWMNEQGDEWLCQVIQFASRKGTGASAVSAGEHVDDAWLSEQMERIGLLKNVSLFHGLSGRELSLIAMRMERVSCPKGSFVFRQNDPGDALYLIQSGRAGVYQGKEKLRERQAGDCFGQTAILTRRLRTATVKAEDSLVLWRLESAAFYDVIFDRSGIALEMMKLLSRRLRSKLAQKPNTAKDERQQAQAMKEAAAGSSETAQEELAMGGDHILRRVLILQKIELFARLSHEDVIALAQMVEEVEYAPGESICRVDDYGDTLYGIIEGSVRVHKGSETFAVLGEGECFGEMAVIDSGLRSADCTAASRAVLLQLHRDQVFTLCFQNIGVLRGMMQVLADRLRGML